MKISRYAHLTARQKEALADLVAACRRQDGFHLSCPSDGNRFFLLWDENGELASALAVYDDDEIPECRAFTRTDCRRRGYFRRLLTC